MNIKHVFILAYIAIPANSLAVYYEKCYEFTSIKNSNYVCGKHGNCTWWAAYKRPDIKGLPSFSDAGNWYAAAKNHGYSLGTKPAVGAIAVFSSGKVGHVASVVNVYDDGSFLVTEMDYYGYFGDGMSVARYYPDGNHYHRLPNGAIYPKGLQSFEYKLSGFIYYRSCMFLNDDTGVICWDYSSDGQFTWPEDAYNFTLYKKTKKGGCTEDIFKRSIESETARGRAYFDEVSEGRYGEYPDAKYVDLGVYCANGKADEGNLTGIGGIGGAGYSTSPTDPPASGKLPDFITSKVTMGNKDGNHEKYTWKINETAYVHDYIDNIGDADWQGSAKEIKVPFYLSKGSKKDDSSKWVRISRQEIKKEHLKVKDQPKHESITFKLQDWANDGTIMPGRTYNFVVCADRPKDEDSGDGDVKEKHKSNNCSTEAVFYVDYGPPRNVDLLARNLALTGGRSSLQAGEKYGLQVEISNIGTEQPWNGFSSSYEIKGPGTGGVWQRIGEDTSRASSLYPNATHFENMSSEQEVAAPMVGGDYVFRACADSTQAVPETDESNNCTDELAVYIAPPPMPDLITEGLQLTHGRTSLIAGELYGLTVNVRNIGEVGPSSYSYTSYEIKGPGTGDAWQRVAEDGTMAEHLLPGMTHWEEISDEQGLHIPTAAGTYTARACADYKGNAPESDESNNCSEMTFEVEPQQSQSCVILNPLASLPTTGSFDLAVTSIEFPDTVQQGDSMHPKARLCGVSGSSPTTQAIWGYANCDGTGFTEIDRDHDYGLTAGQCTTEEIKTDEHKATMAPGKYIMYFIANGASQVPESDHSNNVSAKEFVVE